jgi:hypothetical protein
MLTVPIIPFSKKVSLWREWRVCPLEMVVNALIPEEVIRVLEDFLDASKV